MPMVYRALLCLTASTQYGDRSVLVFVFSASHPGPLCSIPICFVPHCNHSHQVLKAVKEHAEIHWATQKRALSNTVM